MDVLARESQSDRPAANSISGDERTVLTGRPLALVPDGRIGQNGSLCDGSFREAREMADLDKWRKPPTLERGREADLLRFTGLQIDGCRRCSWPRRLRRRHPARFVSGQHEADQRRAISIQLRWKAHSRQYADGTGANRAPAA